MHRWALRVVVGAAVGIVPAVIGPSCRRAERAPSDEMPSVEQGAETAALDEHDAAARWRIGPICIDPGHGGRDSGTIGPGGLAEKAITLDVAERVREALEADGATVVLTRADDRHVSLAERTSTCTKAGAGLFVSIHVNGFHEPKVRGFEVFYFNGGPSSKGVEAAEAIQNALHEALETRDRGVRHADFSVLAATRCPAVLVEVGYLTNADEAARLAQDDYRRRIADALVAGIKAFGLDDDAQPPTEEQ